MHAIDQLRARLCVLERVVGITDHGALTGLADDDHPQYLTTDRHDTTARHGSTVVDHGLIAGLGDDDHTQYHNDARGDARYLKLTGGTVSGDVAIAGTLDLKGGSPAHTILLPTSYDSRSASIIVAGCEDLLCFATKRGISVSVSRGPDNGTVADMFTLHRHTYASWNNVNTTPVTITIDLTSIKAEGPFIKAIGIAFGDRNCEGVDFTVEIYHDSDGNGTYEWRTVADVTNNSTYELIYYVNSWRVRTIRITVTKAGSSDRVGVLRIGTIFATSPMDARPTGHLLGAGGDTMYGDLAIIGKLVDSTPCGCRVYRNSTQSIPSGTVTALSWNTEVADTDNCWSSGNPTRLVASRSGYYLIGCNWTIDSVPAGRVTTSIRRNGTTQVLAAFEIDPTSTTYQQIALVTGMVWMNAGDYAEAYVYSSGGAVTVAAADANNQHKNQGWIVRIA